MAISSGYFSYTIFFLILQLLLPTILYASNDCRYTSIIAFGNSITDTGNLKNIDSVFNITPPQYFFPPYGETFFHKPTGRCSDGRLIIDFFAKGLGFPFIPPYVGSKENGNKTELEQGVNYAVVGAYALNTSFHEARGVFNSLTNVSLGDELEWFKRSLSSFCTSSSDCKQKIRHSLFLVGEIGGNDYSMELVAGKSIKQVKSFVPLVIDKITTTVKKLIELGGKIFVVPNLLPIECTPLALTLFKSSDARMYDNTTGCLISIKKLEEYHNQLLQRELHKIRKNYPKVNVIYADYYNAALQLYRSPKQFGFVQPLRACCGGGGPYDYNPSALCGERSSTVCAHPNTFVNWDEIHLTEAAYRMIYKSVFQGSYSIPRFSSLCPAIAS
ncbi:GDSL esterase/lipase At1g28570 [Lactuca sativa]|uniref:Uncharacterized protein n=1 Tax=Lactuca sativa TaxID=4236 RepID=A0A9R1WR97_LACSA|nr:GDSL esterase/lipase At1g28570 [Lactuca sativa]KAJ0228243.1 hypothetical protein LSAT_V11C100045400 [Lactuca sativa]